MKDEVWKFRLCKKENASWGVLWVQKDKSLLFKDSNKYMRRQALFYFHGH